MKILVKEEFYTAVGEQVASAFPDVEFLLVDRDLGVRPASDGDARAGDESFDIAWGSQGVFLEAGEGSFIDRLAKSTTVKWFQSPGAGNDQTVVRELLDRGVTVTGIHVHSVSISEYVLRAVLDEFQDAEAWRSAQRAHEWAPHAFREVQGTRWLIVGVGAAGSDVARRARAFGAHVVGVRRHPTGEEPVDEMIAPEGIREHLPATDVVVLTAPATSSTRGLVGDEFLAQMKEGSVLVNPARGALIDDDALLRAVDRGVPRRAVLDALSIQPLPADHPFWSHPRITVTPHTSGRGSGRAERSAAVFAENLRRYLSGEALVDDVSRRV